MVSERLKIKLSNLGLVKKDKQLDARKLCSFFAKPQKQIGEVYFSSITYRRLVPKFRLCDDACSKQQLSCIKNLPSMFDRRAQIALTLSGF
jgi:hypothetical protein